MEEIDERKEHLRKYVLTPIHFEKAVTDTINATNANIPASVDKSGLLANTDSPDPLSVTNPYTPTSSKSLSGDSSKSTSTVTHKPCFVRAIVTRYVAQTQKMALVSESFHPQGTPMSRTRIIISTESTCLHSLHGLFSWDWSIPGTWFCFIRRIE